MVIHGQILIVCILKFVRHSYINYLPVFHHFFNANCLFHFYNTLSKDDLHSRSFGTSLGQRSVTYKGIVLWYSLSDELKGIVSAHKFVKH